MVFSACDKTHYRPNAAPRKNTMNSCEIRDVAVNKCITQIPLLHLLSISCLPALRLSLSNFTNLLSLQ